MTIHLERNAAQPGIPVVIRPHDVTRTHVSSTTSAVQAAPAEAAEPGQRGTVAGTDADIAALRERGLRARRLGDDARSARVSSTRASSAWGVPPVRGIPRHPEAGKFAAATPRAAAYSSVWNVSCAEASRAESSGEYSSAHSGLHAAARTAGLRAHVEPRSTTVRPADFSSAPALGLNQAMVSAAAGIIVGFVFFVLVLALV